MSDEKKDAKEELAIQKVEGVNKRYETLLANGAIVIDSQEKADLASALIAEYSTVEQFIDSLWREEARIADQLHKSLTGKIGKYTGPTKQKILLLRGACAAWLTAIREREEKEAREREEQQRQAEAEREKSGKSMFGDAEIEPPDDDEEQSYSDLPAVAVIPKVRIAGMNSRDSYAVEVFDLKKLLSAVVAGVAPIEALQPSEKFFKSCETETKWKLAKEGKRGKVQVKLLYPGVEIKRGVSLARNPKRS